MCRNNYMNTRNNYIKNNEKGKNGKMERKDPVSRKRPFSIIESILKTRSNADAPKAKNRTVCIRIHFAIEKHSFTSFVVVILTWLFPGRRRIPGSSGSRSPSTPGCPIRTASGLGSLPRRFADTGTLRSPRTFRRRAFGTCETHPSATHRARRP